MREVTRASAWNGFSELVVDLGGDADAILAAVHIDKAMLAEPDRYLPLRAYIECQEIAAAKLKRPDFGLMFGARQTFRMLGPLSIAIANAPTARAAIEMAIRYIHTHNPSYRMSLSPMPGANDDFISIRQDFIAPEKSQQYIERALSSLHCSLAEVGGAEYAPQQVWIAHKPLSPQSVYQSVFGITPKFEQPLTGIAISRKALDAWQPGRSPELRDIAEEFLKALGPPRDAAFAEQVADLIRGLMPAGEATAAQAAAALGIHERTLQRRLHDEGSSFEKIKDNVRRTMAERLLARPDLPLTQIAMMLDYADPSAFTRSARRWFGEAPTATRKRLQANAAAASTPRTTRVNSTAASLKAKRSQESP